MLFLQLFCICLGLCSLVLILYDLLFECCILLSQVTDCFSQFITLFQIFFDQSILVFHGLLQCIVGLDQLLDIGLQISDFFWVLFVRVAVPRLLRGLLLALVGQAISEPIALLFVGIELYPQVFVLCLLCLVHVVYHHLFV